VATALDGTIDVTQVFSTGGLCRAARRWLGGDLGDAGYGGDSSAVATALDGTIDVTQVFSTTRRLCRAARRWLGGDLGRCLLWRRQQRRGDATRWHDRRDAGVFDGTGAFAALRADGSVVTWGVPAMAATAAPWRASCTMW
jgi:hypothetical protein